MLKSSLGFLDSLPPREFAAGMAEVVKVGLIADAALLDTLEAQAGAAMPAAVLAKVIEAAVRVKVEVVAADERESGRRAILNFGHTVGHAIEAASGFQLLHGEAVSRQEARGERRPLRLGSASRPNHHRTHHPGSAQAAASFCAVEAQRLPRHGIPDAQRNGEERSAHQAQ